MKGSQQRIAEVLEHHRYWMTNCLDVYQRGLDGIEEWAQREFQGLLVLPGDLQAIAMYYGIKGTLAWIDGVEGGTEAVATSLTCHGLAMMIQTQVNFRSAQGSGLTSETSKLGCLACVSHSLSEMAAGALQRIDGGEGFLLEGWWEERRFEPFVLGCYRILGGEPAMEVELDFPHTMRCFAAGTMIGNWSQHCSESAIIIAGTWSTRDGVGARSLRNHHSICSHAR
jgi:hypothetical protein